MVDDVFSWRPDNTVDWWVDESIEFFIGFYGITGEVSHHSWWGRDDEPDYRIVFRPDTLQVDAWPNEYYIGPSSANYHFESGGTSQWSSTAGG